MVLILDGRSEYDVQVSTLKGCQTNEMKQLNAVHSVLSGIRYKVGSKTAYNYSILLTQEVVRLD